MEDKEISTMNVIPLVDIMLVLLTIIFVTATFILQGSIPVKLPYAKTSETKESKGYQIVIDRNGKISFEGKEVSLKELEIIFSGLNKDSQISLYADREGRVQALVDILDLLKKFGFEKAFIRTEVLR